MTKYCLSCGLVRDSKLPGKGSYPCVCLDCWLKEFRCVF